MKKWISLLLCAVMALSIMPQSALAEDEEPVGETAALHEAETPMDPLTASAFSDAAEEDDPLEPVAVHEAETPIDPLTASVFSDAAEEDDPLEPAVPEQPATPGEDAPLEPIAPAEDVPAEPIPEQPLTPGTDAPAEAEPAALPAPVIVRAQEGDVFVPVTDGAIHNGDCVLVVGKYDDNYYVLTTELYPNSSRFLLGELISGETGTNDLPDQIVFSSSSHMCAFTLNNVVGTKNPYTGEFASQDEKYLSVFVIDAAYTLKLATKDTYEGEGKTCSWNLDLLGNRIYTKNPIYTDGQGEQTEFLSLAINYRNGYYRFGANASSTPIYLYRRVSAPTPQTYTVTYNANGGEGAPESQIKTAGTPLTLSNTVPVRQWYDFLGWATSADGEVVYRPGDSYDADESVTLYAVWKEHVFAAVIGCSLNLKGTIGLNFYVQTEDGASATLTMEGADPISFVLDPAQSYYQADADRYFLSYPNLHSNQMHKSVTLQVLDANGDPLPLNGSGQTAFSYSAADWAEHMQDDTKTGRIAKTLLNYGAYAENYFNSANNTPCLADETAAVTPDSQYNAVLPENWSATGYKGMTLTLNGDTSLRLYFNNYVTAKTGDKSGQGSHGYYVEKSGIPANRLGAAYDFVVEYEGVEYTFRCSAMSYANDAITDKSSPETLVRLCQSLYLYFAAATNYFADRNESAPIPVLD